jgi:curved DNA-binding protein
MSQQDPFTDYYGVLKVIPTCSPRSLETAYHSLAKKFHPDHAETGDVAKLTEVIEAYKVLRDPDSRAEFDLQYAQATGFSFAPQLGEGSEELSALSDADAHARILMFLYRRRRDQARDAGVGQYTVQEMLNCSEDLFDFHLWYLREKGFIQTTEQGALAITIAGVDHVIAMSQTKMKEKLLLSRPDELPADLEP